VSQSQESSIVGGATSKKTAGGRDDPELLGEKNAETPDASDATSPTVEKLSLRYYVLTKYHLYDDSSIEEWRYPRFTPFTLY